MPDSGAFESPRTVAIALAAGAAARNADANGGAVVGLARDANPPAQETSPLTHPDETVMSLRPEGACRARARRCRLRVRRWRTRRRRGADRAGVEANTVISHGEQDALRRG